MPLLTACIEHNDKDGVKWILDEELAGVEKANCPLGVLGALFCAENGAIDQLQFLCDESYVDLEDSEWAVGRGLLLRAARANQATMVRMLAEDRAVPLSPVESAACHLAEIIGEEKETQSPLTAAAERGRGDVVRLLVERMQVPVDELDLCDRTALSYCSEQMDVAVTLISFGADVSHRSVEEAGLSSREWVVEKTPFEPEEVTQATAEKSLEGTAIQIPVKTSQDHTREGTDAAGGGREGLASSWDSKAVVESKSRLHSDSAIQRRARLLSLTSTASPSLVIDSSPLRSVSATATPTMIVREAKDTTKNAFAGLTVASKFKRAQTGKNILLRSDIEHAKAVLHKATMETDQARTENLDLSVEVQQLKAHVTKLRSNIAAIRKHLDRTAVDSGGLPFNPSIARVGAKRATQPAGVPQRLRAPAMSAELVKRSSAVC